MRRKILAVILCLMMVIAAGCQGSSDKEEKKEPEIEAEDTEKKEEKAEGEEYITWIKEAWEEWKASEVRGFVDSKFNGDQKEVNTIDTAKQQWMKLTYDSGSGGEPRYTDIRIKEGDNNYTFKKQRTGETTYQDLKVLMDSDQIDEESYSDYIAGEILPFDGDGELEVLSVSATQEGEEEINGVKALKIEVSYEMKLKEKEKLTREDVLAQRGWTEEQLNLLSEFRISELVDAYVGATNTAMEGQMTEPWTDHQTYYLSSDGHKLLRKVEIVGGSAYPGTEVLDGADQLVRSLREDMESGYSSEEEAVQWVKDYWGEQWDFDNEMERMMSPDTSGTEVTTDYQTGSECETMCDIPAEATEITWEQYMKHEY